MRASKKSEISGTTKMQLIVTIPCLIYNLLLARIGMKRAMKFQEAVCEGKKAELATYYHESLRGLIILGGLGWILLWWSGFFWRMIQFEIVGTMIWLGVEKHLCLVVKAWAQ